MDVIRQMMNDPYGLLALVLTTVISLLGCAVAIRAIVSCEDMSSFMQALQPCTSAKSCMFARVR